MLDKLYESMNTASIIIIGIALMLFCAFLMTRLTKLIKLPNVTAYIITGVLIGPFVLNLIHPMLITSMDFLADIALAFISFGVGRYLHLKNMGKGKGKNALITIFEVFIPFVLIFLTMYFIFSFSLEFSLIMGAIAGATAPASTLMTIRQYNAKGEFVDSLIQIIALDNVLSLLTFNICIAIAGGAESGGISAMTIIEPILYNFLLIAVGLALGFVLKKFISAKRSEDNRLMITVAMILGLTGLCTALNISPLLACMAFGASYMNFSNDKNLFKQLQSFSPPIMTLFFVLSGLKLDFSAISVIGVAGIVYFLVRIIGKYTGAYFGAKITKSSKIIKDYLGLALIPQAGVAIGLAILGQRILPGETGDLLLTIILATSFLYELVGPATAKLSLNLSGAIKPTEEEGKKKVKEVQISINDLPQMKELEPDNKTKLLIKLGLKKIPKKEINIFDFEELKKKEIKIKEKTPKNFKNETIDVEISLKGLDIFDECDRIIKEKR